MKAADILAFLDSLERIVLAVVARLGPWLAPLPPAFFVARASARRLATGDAVAWLIGAVVEAAGIAAASATFSAYTWNRERPSKMDPRAPVGLGLALCGVYLAVGVIISVVLELDSGLAVFVPGLFFALAGQVYAVKAMMSDQVRREVAARQAKVERSLARKEAIREKNQHGEKTSTYAGAGDQAAARPDFEAALLRLASVAQGACSAAQIADDAGIGRTTAYQLIRYGLARGLVRRAGRGRYEVVKEE